MRFQERRDDFLVDERGALRLRGHQPQQGNNFELKVERDPTDEEERGLDEGKKRVDDPIGEPLFFFFFLFWKGRGESSSTLLVDGEQRSRPPAAFSGALFLILCLPASHHWLEASVAP